MNSIDECSLCQLPLPLQPISDQTLRFCCHGCHAVYTILATKGEVEDYQAHPLFQQALQYGLISNQALHEQLRVRLSDANAMEIQKLHFEVSEMWCPSCAELIRLVLLQQKGIKNCIIDYATDLAMVEFAPQQIAREQIFAQITNLGYQPYQLHETAQKAVSNSLYLRFIIAAFCALNVMMFAYPVYASYFDADQQGMGQLFAWLSLAVSLPVVTYAAWPIYKRFFSALTVGIYGMEALVTIGVLAAFAVSLHDLVQGGSHVYFDSLTVVVAFVLLGKIIESKAKFSAKESLLRLNRAMPRRGRCLQEDGSFAYRPIKDFVVGDKLQVLMGETIVLDGIVVQGEGLCNESLMTGEPQLIAKSIGDKVVAGSTLQQGNVLISVTATANTSTLQRIIGLIEQDLGRKSTYVRAADKIIRWFVPSVLLLAFAVASIYGIYLFLNGQEALTPAILRAVTILLISCPCALGIAAPLAESYLIDTLTRLGVIVRNRGALQFLGCESHYVFDKTGTLTEGRFEVLEGLSSLSQTERSVLFGLVAHSHHPLSVAIFTALAGEPRASFDRIEEVAGSGLQGVIGDKTYFLGSHNFLQRHGIEVPCNQIDTASIATHVYFAEQNTSVHRLTLGDRLRPGVKEALQKLQPGQLWLLSGDAERSVSAVADACGITNYRSTMGPLDKREMIASFKNQGAIVTMVGDGINDAPALTAADVGISMVCASDISIQVSDIMLTSDKMEVLAEMRSLASRGRKIIQQNLFWAFFYNIIGIALAAVGLLSPLFAAFAMTASSLIVLFNARRIKAKD